MMEEFEQFEHDSIEKEVERITRLNNARRSPYPTIVIEIQATPPLSEEEIKAQECNKSDNTEVLREIVKKLESIFAKSAAIHKKMEGKDSVDDLFDSIGNVSSFLF